MAKKTMPSLEKVVDSALALADDVGWDRLTMRDLAGHLKISPATLQIVTADKNAIADAWFQRAITAMLAPLPDVAHDAPTRDRLELLMMRWFEALSPHRRVTSEMLSDKMWPFHPHHWAPMIFDLSRLVQWWRDAGGMTAEGRRRQIEEIAMTGIFLATLRFWRSDQGGDPEAVRAYLARKLRGPLFD